MTDQVSTVSGEPEQNRASAETGEQLLPLYSEAVAISRRKVERTVQVHVRTDVHAHLVDEALTQMHVEIERVAIGLPVDAVPPVREEGDTTVISIVEEVLVVERRLILKEEIHLRRVRTTQRHRETVTLREQQAVIERADPDRRKSSPLSEQAPIPQPQSLKD